MLSISSLEPEEDGSDGEHAQIMNGALLIAGSDAAKAFQPVHETLQQVSLTIRYLVNAGPPLPFLSRNDDPDAAPPQVPPNLLTAVAFVSCDPIRTNPRPSPAWSLRRAGLHQGFEHTLFMALSRRDQQSNRLTVALCSEMDLGAKATLAAPQGFVLMLGSPLSSCPCRMLMRSDNGSVHMVETPIELAVSVCLLLDTL